MYGYKRRGRPKRIYRLHRLLGSYLKNKTLSICSKIKSTISDFISVIYSKIKFRYKIFPGKFIRFKDWIVLKYNIQKRKFDLWNSKESTGILKKYVKDLIKVYLIYGIILSFPVWYYFKTSPTVLGIIGLGITAYVLKVEVPGIIKDCHR